jgi:hypothetical protein
VLHARRSAKNSIFSVCSPRRASGRPRRKGAKSCCSSQTWEFSFQRRAKLNANAHVRAAGNRWGDDEKTSEKVEQGNDFCKLLQLQMQGLFKAAKFIKHSFLFLCFNAFLLN